jgi:retron-type reverse transcriptase
MSDEELKREIAYNKGRIATKTLTNVSRIEVRDNIINTIQKLDAKLWIFTYNNPEISNMYHTFQIPKRSGGFREICAPNDEIKTIQEEILKIFTKNLKFLPHNAAHGFTKKRNCKTALEVHKAHGSRWFLKLDIKDFFPSTTNEIIANAMNKVYPFCLLNDDKKNTLIRVCTLNGATPQGAPTSPMITNMVMVPKDVQITKYCKEHGLVYTRYADDILISSRVSFDWQQVQNDIQEMLGEYTLKTEKTRYGSFNGRNWNLGLMYNNKFEITVGHKKKQLVKNMIHNFTTKEEQHTLDNWYKLIGIVGYCNYIEPEYFSKYLDIVKAAKPA